MGFHFVFAISVAGLVTIAGACREAQATIGASPACKVVQVTGGDYNGMTGGVQVAHVLVKNVGPRACTVIGRPWVRISYLPHPVTVADFSAGAGAGSPLGRVVLGSGAVARAEILLRPGGCSRGRKVIFVLSGSAGWSSRGVRIAGSMCDDGSGEILVGTFHRASS